MPSHSSEVLSASVMPLRDAQIDPDNNLPLYKSSRFSFVKAVVLDVQEAIKVQAHLEAQILPALPMVEAGIQAATHQLVALMDLLPLLLMLLHLG